MKARIEYQKTTPQAVHAMLGLEHYVQGSELDQRLLELVRMRASQMNGCAYCLDMHSKDARAEGETEQRLYGLSAWRETPYYSDRERAALEWTEAITDISHSHAGDDIYDRVRAHFSEDEMVKLTMAIIAINGWNRLAIGFRTPPGPYQPRTQTAARL
jgi:AhpD family alkylhydroperoxidase